MLLHFFWGVNETKCSGAHEESQYINTVNNNQTNRMWSLGQINFLKGELTPPSPSGPNSLPFSPCCPSPKTLSPHYWLTEINGDPLCSITTGLGNCTSSMETLQFRCVQKHGNCAEGNGERAVIHTTPIKRLLLLSLFQSLSELLWYIHINTASRWRQTRETH